jgi:hypothetical protein
VPLVSSSLSLAPRRSRFLRPRVLVRLLQLSEAPLMGWVAPRANLHSARLSWVAADIRPIRDSRRRLAASTNRERRKSLCTLQGQFPLPRLSGNYHRVRCSALMDSLASTCAAPQLDQFISRAGWRIGSASLRRARRQRVAVVRYAPREPNAGGHRVEAAGIALPVGPVARLAEVQEPGGACGEAGG